MGDADLTLLERWIAGDSVAGNMLFSQYFTPLYRFFDHKTEGDIDDLVQETFVACLKNRDTFKRQSSFRTYLFAIARYVLLGYWRRRATGQHAVPVDEISIASLSTSVGTRLSQQQDRAKLLDALRTLPIDQQLLLEMYYWHDLDRDQLAEVFDVETATIGSRLFRARHALLGQLAASSNGAAPATDESLDAWARALPADKPS